VTATKFLILALSSLVATEPAWNISKVQAAVSSALSSFFPQPSLLTSQVLQTFLEPIEANLARNSHVYRDGTTLRLLGDKWTASGANVYWLGLDENVIPAAGEAYYKPLKASYPTKGRTTEIMATLATLGAKVIRSQTLGVSVGNPLSLMPSLGV